MTAKPLPTFHIAGQLFGFSILEAFNTLDAARTRLADLAAAANDIAEGDPRTRNAKAQRFVLTDEERPDLMDAFTGETLVGILEQ
jgi:hypothetical protein